MNSHQDKYELELAHAPDVDPVWTEEFLIEARLRDVPGDQIGEALAEVNSHVADSGVGAADAFGDPRVYAAALAETAAVPSAGLLWSVVPAAVQTGGMLAVLNALPSALRGESFEITVGLVVALVLLGLLFSLLAWRSTPVLRLILDRPWLAILLNFALIAAMVGALFIPGVVASTSAWAVSGIGLALLVVGTVVGLSRDLKGLDEDPIRAPLAKPEAPRRSWLTWLNHLMIPVFTVILGAIFISVGL